MQPLQDDILSHDQRNTLQNIVHYGSLLSVFLSGFTLLTFAVHNQLGRKRLAARLAFAFVLCAFILDAIIAIGTFIGHEKLARNHDLCLAQAIIIEYTGTSLQFLWFCISIHLRLRLQDALEYRISGADNESRPLLYDKAVVSRERARSRVFLLITTLLPLMFTVAPFVAKHSVYGLTADPWCWVKMDAQSRRVNGPWEFAIMYGEFGILLLIGMYIWAQMLYRTRRIRAMIAQLRHRNAAREENIAERVSLMRHVLFVAVFAIVFAILFAHRLILWIHPEHEIYYLYVMASCSVAGIGTYAFIIFGLTRENVRMWAERLGIRAKSPSFGAERRSLSHLTAHSATYT